MSQKLSIVELNQLSSQEFQNKFGNVIEHCPEAPVFVSVLLPFRNIDQVIFAFHHYLDQIPDDKKAIILESHPELAHSKLESLTTESQSEQKSAGLDSSDFNVKEFKELNSNYKTRFGFPFVICVRDNTRDQIIAALNRRIHNDRDLELIIGIKEVKKICELRIRDLIQ